MSGNNIWFPKEGDATKKGKKIIFGFLRMSFQVFIFLRWNSMKSSDEGSTSQETINFLFSTFHMIKESAFRKLLQLDESI